MLRYVGVLCGCVPDCQSPALLVIDGCLVPHWVHKASTDVPPIQTHACTKHTTGRIAPSAHHLTLTQTRTLTLTTPSTPDQPTLSIHHNAYKQQGTFEGYEKFIKANKDLKDSHTYRFGAIDGTLLDPAGVEKVRVFYVWVGGVCDAERHEPFYIKPTKKPLLVASHNTPTPPPQNKQISKLPSKLDLYTKLAFALKQPSTRLAKTLKAVPTKLTRAIKLSFIDNEAEPAGGEEPAAE